MSQRGMVRAEAARTVGRGLGRKSGSAIKPATRQGISMLRKRGLGAIQMEDDVECAPGVGPSVHRWGEWESFTPVHLAFAPPPLSLFTARLLSLPQPCPPMVGANQHLKKTPIFLRVLIETTHYFFKPHEGKGPKGGRVLLWEGGFVCVLMNPHLLPSTNPPHVSLLKRIRDTHRAMNRKKREGKKPSTHLWKGR
jgi:hypothetical protein